MKGYIYFIISNTGKIYVGQARFRTKKTIYMGEGDFREYTKWPERIDEYTNLFRERERNRNTNNDKTQKHFEGLIKYQSANMSKCLLEDIADMDNTFEIKKFDTDNHMMLERTYIRYLIENEYSLYNKRLYTKHEWSPSDIDPEIIEQILK